MAKRKPPGEPPPDKPFGQNWARHEPTKVGVPLAIPTLSLATRIKRTLIRGFRQALVSLARGGLKLLANAFSTVGLAYLGAIIALFFGIFLLKGQFPSLGEVRTAAQSVLTKLTGVEVDTKPVQPPPPLTSPPNQQAAPAPQTVPEPAPVPPKRRATLPPQKEKTDPFVEWFERAFGSKK